MVLGKKKILEEIEKGNIRIQPFDEKLLEDIVYNIRIGKRIYVLDKRLLEIIDLEKDFWRYAEEYKLGKAPFIIHPGETAFIESLEEIHLSKKIMGLLHPKAKLPLMGILIHTGGGKIDPEFKGKLVIGISNIGGIPIRIKKGMVIAQISFFRVE